MQVSDEHVEALCSDTSQRFCHAGGVDYVKSLAFKGGIHHGTNSFIVIHQQDSMGNKSSVGVIQHCLSSRVIVKVLLRFILGNVQN